MAYRLPPLSALRTFEAAARHLSFTKAAEELHVTPAAVSQQIKKLESWFATPLFKRRPNVLQLTKEGLAIYPKVRDGLDCFAAAVVGMRPDRGHALDVVAPPALATRWLVPRLSRFSAAHPQLALRISANPENIDGPQTVLAPPKELGNPHGETSEIAIRFGAGLYPGYQVEKILTPDYVLVCSPRLQAGEPPLRAPHDLGSQILIHDESIPSVEQRPSWDEWLKLAGVDGIDTERGPRFSNSILVLEAALEGQGVALALEPQIEADVAAGRLVVPFPIRMPSAYAYFLVMPEAMANQDAVLAFRQWLYAEIGAGYG